ncbi:MAG: cobalamin-dependent protein, partial [Christensenellales bacterium]
ALSGLDDGFGRYIEAMGKAETSAEKAKEISVRECVIKGLKDDGLNIVRSRATADNFMRIINEEIIPSLDELGVRYEKGTSFLPQLIAGAGAASAMLDYIKSEFIRESGETKATLLFLTVKGDVHDIGKNIVKAVVSNYGYKIIDLGKNVSSDEVIEAIERYKPDGIGMSALMTTTLDSMKETAERVRELYPDMFIMAGGAVVTADFAESIGAVYSSDAQSAVKILNEKYIRR